MEIARKLLSGACFATVPIAAVRMKTRTTEDAGRKEIEAFNKRYVELYLTISVRVEDIAAKMPGYKVTKQETEFHNIHVCGDWASEWATEHQVVQPPEGKPPIDSHGKMALVLHRAARGLEGSAGDVECSAEAWRINLLPPGTTASDYSWNSHRVTESMKSSACSS
jgi:hypothetical protein